MPKRSTTGRRSGRGWLPLNEGNKQGNGIRGCSSWTHHKVLMPAHSGRLLCLFPLQCFLQGSTKQSPHSGHLQWAAEPWWKQTGTISTRQCWFRLKTQSDSTELVLLTRILNIYFATLMAAILMFCSPPKIKYQIREQNLTIYHSCQYSKSTAQSFYKSPDQGEIESYHITVV